MQQQQARFHCFTPLWSLFTAPCRCWCVQVRHMVLVETDVQRQARLAAEAAARAPRPPVTVQHLL